MLNVRTIEYHPKRSRWLKHRIKGAAFLLVMLLFVETAVTMLRHPYFFVRSYHRFRLARATTVERKIQISGDWAAWTCNRGTPKLVFDLFPGAKPKDDGHVLCLKTDWDDPQYVWANKSEAGIASWDVQRFADCMGMTPITDAELNEEFKRWSATQPKSGTVPSMK